MNLPTTTIAPVTEKAPRVFVPDAAIQAMIAEIPGLSIRPAFIPGSRKTVIQVVKNEHKVLAEARTNALLIQAMAKALWGQN